MHPVRVPPLLGCCHILDEVMELEDSAGLELMGGKVHISNRTEVLQEAEVHTHNVNARFGVRSPLDIEVGPEVVSGLAPWVHTWHTLLRWESHYWNRAISWPRVCRQPRWMLLQEPYSGEHKSLLGSVRRSLSNVFFLRNGPP